MRRAGVESRRWLGTPASAIAFRRARKRIRLRITARRAPTEAVARSAPPLGDQGGLAGAARRLGIGRSTARTLPQRTFARTGTPRQGVLVRLMMAQRVLAAEPPARADLR
jgi:hypothetical protein